MRRIADGWNIGEAQLQYNSITNTVYANARLRWKYRTGSKLFVVLNEERNRKPAAGGAAPAKPRLIVKVNRFLRF